MDIYICMFTNKHMICLQLFHARVMLVLDKHCCMPYPVVYPNHLFVIYTGQ